MKLVSAIFLVLIVGKVSSLTIFDVERIVDQRMWKSVRENVMSFVKATGNSRQKGLTEIVVIDLTSNRQSNEILTSLAVENEIVFNGIINSSGLEMTTHKNPDFVIVIAESFEVS